MIETFKKFVIHLNLDQAYCFTGTIHYFNSDNLIQL